MSAHSIVTLAIAAASLCSGCVAFNVGKPKTLTHSESVTVSDSKPSRIEIVSVRGWQKQNTNDVVVGLVADADEVFARRTHRETYVIREQRRLAVGLYPGAGEIFLMPKGAFKSSVFSDESKDHGVGVESLPDPGQYVLLQSLGMVVTLGIPHAFSTAYSLFAAPFDDWDCHHGMMAEDFAKERVLRKTYANGRNRLESNPHSHWYSGKLEPFSHCGLAGCHKYVALFVDGPRKSPATLSGIETRRREISVSGPFVAELSIPSLNYCERKRVSELETRTVFPLPEVSQDCTVEAVLSFFEDDAAKANGASSLTRQVLAKASGRTWRFDLKIEASDRAGPPPDQQLRLMTRHTAFERFPAKSIMQEDGWFYDHESRRGWMRFAIPDGMSVEDVRRWVRDNIAALVAEKNILLEAGVAPPSNVTFRSLGESLENGILTVEFATDQ